MGSRKMIQMNLFTGQKEKRDTDIEKKHLDTKGVKGGWNELGDRG